MYMKRIFVLALMALLLCVPVWAMATPDYYIQDIPHYVEDDGTVSVVIGDEQITWLQASSQGKTAWFGLDNSDQIFDNNSRFRVRWLKEQDAEWGIHYDDLDDKNKSVDWMRMLELGVVDSNGGAVYECDTPFSLYMQLEDNWDTSNLQVCYINSGTDETFNERVTQMESPGGEKSKFVAFSTSHFSPYCVYKIGEYDSNDLPQTGDNSNVILWSALACISLFGMTVLVYKRKEA